MSSSIQHKKMPPSVIFLLLLLNKYYATAIPVAKANHQIHFVPEQYPISVYQQEAQLPPTPEEAIIPVSHISSGLPGNFQYSYNITHPPIRTGVIIRHLHPGGQLGLQQQLQQRVQAVNSQQWQGGTAYAPVVISNPNNALTVQQQQDEQNRQAQFQQQQDEQNRQAQIQQQQQDEQNRQAQIQQQQQDEQNRQAQLQQQQQTQQQQRLEFQDEQEQLRQQQQRQQDQLLQQQRQKNEFLQQQQRQQNQLQIQQQQQGQSQAPESLLQNVSFDTNSVQQQPQQILPQGSVQDPRERDPEGKGIGFTLLNRRNPNADGRQNAGRSLIFPGLIINYK
jgi:hypothetical protein